jgi:hypothetical protein
VPPSSFLPKDEVDVLKGFVDVSEDDADDDTRADFFVSPNVAVFELFLGKYDVEVESLLFLADELVNLPKDDLLSIGSIDEFFLRVSLDEPFLADFFAPKGVIVLSVPLVLLKELAPPPSLANGFPVCGEDLLPNDG